MSPLLHHNDCHSLDWPLLFPSFFWLLSHPLLTPKEVPVGGLSPGWLMAAPWADSSTLNYPQASWGAHVEWLSHTQCVIASCSFSPAPLTRRRSVCVSFPYDTQELFSRILLWKIIISINKCFHLQSKNYLSWHFPLWLSQQNITSNPQNCSSVISRQINAVQFVTVKLQCFWVTEFVMPNTRGIIKTWGCEYTATVQSAQSSISSFRCPWWNT